jgi:DUF971 family protein
MAGLNRDTPIPTEIKLHQQSHLMELVFSDGATFQLSYELLRVLSPSAEVRGHGAGQEVLQSGKRNIAIVGIEAVGNYAIRPVFSDGHDSGLYSWDLLYEMGRNQQSLWQSYLARLEAAGLNRDVGTTEIDKTKTAAPPHGGCGKH